jgi:hypothetical protein
MKTFDTLAHQQIFLNHCVLDKEITHLDVKELEKEEMFNKELKQLSLLNHSNHSISRENCSCSFKETFDGDVKEPHQGGKSLLGFC